jgi:hypothetical protein
MTQFLSMDSSAHMHASAANDFLCGPAKLSAGRGRSLPSSFATIHIRMQLPPGMNVDRVTQLPLWDEGQVQGGHSTGRDIAISVEHDNHYLTNSHLNRRAGITPVDEDEPRPLVRGDEWPSQLPKAPKAKQKVVERIEEADTDRASVPSHESSELMARVAKLESDQKAREATLTSALAQAGDKLDLPQGAKASRCCSCDGVVTFSPTGKCDCPLGGAETRPAPPGCQAAAPSFKGRAPCADGCREAFWGKEKAAGVREAMADEAAETVKKTNASQRKTADVGNTKQEHAGVVGKAESSELQKADAGTHYHSAKEAEQQLDKEAKVQ